MITLNWVALTLFSAFTLASADAATKAWLRDLSLEELLIVRFFIPALWMLPWLGDFSSLRTLPITFWGWIIALIPLEIIAMRLYMAAIRDHPLSLTMPYQAFTSVFVVGIAWLLLDERVSLIGILGIILVVAGAWWLSSTQTFENPGRSWWFAGIMIFRNPGTRKMLIVAGIYALTATLGKGAVTFLNPTMFGALYSNLLGLTTLILFILPRPGRLRKLLRHPWAILSVGALLGMMILTHFLAIQQVEVAYMIGVKRMSLLFSMLYGAWLFHETDLARRLPAGLLMLCGVSLLIFS